MKSFALLFITALLLVMSACTLTPLLKTVPNTGQPAPIPITPISGVKVPKFDHIIVIVFENQDYNAVIGSKNMPTFNKLADQNVLLTQYHGVAHPSLPNYIALIGGSTFGINTDCKDCFVNQPSLPDLIEASGRTWKTYQENLPSPCYVGDATGYAQRHDPFIYFDAIRKDTERCQKSVVPLTELDKDLQQNKLPDYSFIMPNLCHSGHDCSPAEVDKWLSGIMTKLQGSPALGQDYLISIIFDESERDSSSCCGLPKEAGGRVPAILISPLAKKGYQDNTPLSHYSFLKTILASWNLPNIGYTALPTTPVILSPWVDKSSLP